MDKSKITHTLDELGGSSKAERRPISGILQEMGTHLTEIVRSEVRLARAEVRQEISDLANASVFLVISAAFGLVAFGFILLAIVYALSQSLPPWASALIVGGGVAILAAVFLLVGQKKMKLVHLKPEKTIQSLRENVTWLKTQTK